MITFVQFIFKLPKMLLKNMLTLHFIIIFQNGFQNDSWKFSKIKNKNLKSPKVETNDFLQLFIEQMKILVFFLLVPISMETFSVNDNFTFSVLTNKIILFWN